jgi:hypothetical protein
MVDSKLFNYWVLTGQENNGIRVYTPKKAALNNTQQIENEDSFEIKEDGEFIKYVMSPAGKTMRFIGRYEIEGNTLYSHFKNHYLDSMFNIVALNDKILKIK